MVVLLDIHCPTIGQLGITVQPFYSWAYTVQTMDGWTYTVRIMDGWTDTIELLDKIIQN